MQTHQPQTVTASRCQISRRHITLPPRDPSEPLQTIPVTFIDQEGRQYVIDATVGRTLLEAAEANDIPMPRNCEGGGEGFELWDTQAACQLSNKQRL